MGFIMNTANKNISVEQHRESFKVHRDDTGYGEQHIEFATDDLDVLIGSLILLKQRVDAYDPNAVEAITLLIEFNEGTRTTRYVYKQPPVVELDPAPPDDQQ